MAGAVADAIIAGVERDRDEIRVGQVRQLAPLARVMPSLADRLVTRALSQSGETGPGASSGKENSEP